LDPGTVEKFDREGNDMNRARKPLLALFVLLFLSGCWNRVELNELSVIMGTAVDVEGDQWVTTFQVVIPQSIATQAGGGGGGSSQPPVSVFSTKGDTLTEAFQRISLESSRTPFFAHNRVLIISERAAREKGVSQIVDFYLRDGETRETVDVVLSRGNARSILEVLNPQEKIPANAIDRIFVETEKQLSMVRRIKLREFAAMLGTPGTSAVAPEIRFAGETADHQSIDELKLVRMKGRLKIGDVGVFRGDKLIGWISREESIGIAWLSDNMNTSVISFPCSDQGPKGPKSTFRVEHSNIKISPSIAGNHVKIKAAIKAQGTLNETGCILNFSKPENIKLMETQISKQIQKDILVSWKKSQSMKVDFFGFGEKVYIHNPRKWKEFENTWYEKLPEVELVPDIRVKVLRTGMINDSFSSIVEE
jgi:spore germination protein KC